MNKKEFISTIGMTKKSILFLLIATLYVSCNGSGTASFDAPEVVDNSNVNSNTNGSSGSNSGSGGSSGSGAQLTFSGISSYSLVTDRSARINWATFSGAAIYHVFSVSGGTTSLIAAVNAPTTYLDVSSLSANTSYTYRVRVMNNDGDFDGNTNDQTLTTNSSPDSPSTIAMQSPSSSSGTDPSPTIRVSNINNGDTIKLYKDNSCTQLIGSATASDTYVDVTASPDLSTGTYSIYATSTNPSGGESTCSTSKVDYEVLAYSCPTGYVAVPANPTVGTSSDFCVMAYEAKNDGSNNPISQADSTPWAGITIINAKSECLSLNSLNGVTDKYDLISNAEWMTIARNIENVDANWTSGSVGIDYLKRGNLYVSGTVPGVTYEGINVYGTSRSSDAKHVLSNGSEIWDLGGNVNEWVDYAKGGTAPTPFPTTCTPNSWAQLTTASFSSCMNDVEYNTENGTYTSAQYTGMLFLSNTQGYGARGGFFYINQSTYQSYYGIFTLITSYSSTATGAHRGFRCVYRP